PFDVTIDCADNPTDFNVVGEVDIFTDNCANLDDVQVKWHDDMANIEDCDGNPVIPRIWTLTDPCGNSRSSTQRITVHNFSMAEVQFPADITIPCDANISDLALTGAVTMPEDACSYLVDTVYYQELGEVSPYKFKRLWICQDYCGHVVSDTQVIDLIDKVKPELQVHDVLVSFADSATVELTMDQVLNYVHDNCDDHVDMAMSQSVFNCEDFIQNPEQVIEITATDDQGNQTAAEITVGLSGGLFLMQCPQNMTFQLDPGQCTQPVTYQIAPEGLCNQVPIVSQIDGTGLTSGDEFPIGKTAQTYLISDQLGNTMQCSFTIDVLEFQGTHQLACQDTLNVSVESDCEALITADMLLEGNNYGCYDDFIITFNDPNVQYENNILLAGPHVGQYLHPCVMDPVS
ncbi:MAG TPA: HYR domain-containing protein, partial [Saprospiraceae bacterium]|nr:HYR domain-containing protein [Saprospiraceae bacterium]